MLYSITVNSKLVYCKKVLSGRCIRVTICFEKYKNIRKLSGVNITQIYYNYIECCPHHINYQCDKIIFFKTLLHLNCSINTFL